MDIEKLAASGAEMPDGLKIGDQLLFLTLRELYRKFQSGAINRSQGHREKQRIMVAYQVVAAQQNLLEYHEKLRHRLERTVGSLHKCGCEHCRQMARVFDGIDRKDPPEDVAELQQWNDRLRDLVQERSERAAKLKTDLDRIGWIIDGSGTAEDKFMKIKEVITHDQN